jgi:gas vesicle protein
MNKRFIIVGILFGVVITAAVLLGSPMFGGFDTLR